MSRRIVLICCLLSLIAALSAARAEEVVRPSPRMAPRPQPMARFTGTIAAGPVCTAGEKQCAIGGAIVWCCRADQQCNYAYPGGCK